MTEPFTIPGEGDKKIVERTRIRMDCDQCGEPATKRHTYLLPDARRNSASSAYGRDDCSWCSDCEVFACDDCNGGREPKVDGYHWCSTFTIKPDHHRFAHMFLHWSERELTTTPATDASPSASLAAAATASSPPALVADGADLGEGE
jgi:hypothetical protein